MFPKTRLALGIFLLALAQQGSCQSTRTPVQQLLRDFAREYRALDIPQLEYDYRDYLRAIPPLAVLDQREAFFRKYAQQTAALDTSQLTEAERSSWKHLRYQIDLHLERCALEKQIQSGSTMAVPAEGLYRLPHGKALYRFYIRYSTGVHISPDEVYQYGLSEVAKIQAEIQAIRERAGLGRDSAAWLQHLNAPAFFLTERDSVVAGYERIKTQVLAHLNTLFEQAPDAVPDIEFMTWPNAGPYTPPGMYSSADNNAYGTAVFQFNFYGSRHNRRAMDWLFLHEAIPGHHFHRFTRKNTAADHLEGLWFAGGTIEGWATYVEYFGEEMGLYRDDWAWLGKWEWDLVRSVRLVLSVGIHDRGWTKDQALAFWKANIPNQDDIAEREITRCTNWPAQVLSYKIGAKKIFELRAAAQQREGAHFDLKRFHTRFLTAGNVPLEIM
ncbi:MAG: DUF885 domain-containing protein [Saprospiraceae bacterium]|nr:DUF885 domain-containing protein [Saprospiraceae bacterium]